MFRETLLGPNHNKKQSIQSAPAESYEIPKEAPKNKK